MTTTTGPRKSLARDQSGQLLVMWMIFMLPMVVLCFGVYNVGVMVSEKMKVQNAADNAAYSAATWNARYMNQMAYLNRAMVANYDTIAAVTGIWSFIDGLDGFVGLIRTLLRVFFNVGEAITPAATALHTANDVFSNVIGGGKKNKKLGAYLEGYNQALSFAQQGLYIANQFGRARVAQTVAWGVDPKIQYWLPSEVWGIQEIANRRDWKESDAQKGLRLTLERSLNALSNGSSFRDLDEFPVIGTLVKIVNLVPCFKITVGPEGFDGPGFNHVTGAKGGKGQVTIAQDDRVYQNDFSGLAIKFDCIIDFDLIAFGHNSDDKRNLPNVGGGLPGANLAFPHVVDEEGDHGAGLFQGKVGGGYIKRNIDCEAAVAPDVGSLDLGASDPGFQKLTETNKNKCGEGANDCTVADIDGDNPSDLPPGPICPAPLTSLDQQKEQRRIAANIARQAEDPPRPPIPKSIIDDDRTCRSIQEEIEDRQDAITDKLKKNFQSSSKPCQTIFIYDTPLSKVKVTQYVQKDGIPDGKRVEGPSVFVYVRKKAGLLPMFSGLGLLNERDVEAYAFGRAYYTQRPNGGTSEKETTFNPFWAGRLEKAPFLFH